MVKINGIEQDAAGTTLTDWLESADYHLEQIVVERNEAIVPKAQYGETVMEDGDIIEIISFMGGG